jgi:serine/threonine-protein kinase RsbW
MIHRFKTACQADNLKEIRSFVELTLHKYLQDDSQVNLLVLAVDEICANRAKHSSQTDNRPYTIEIKIELTKHQTLIFEIIDQGLPFDISNYKEPNLLHLIKEKRKGGMGLMLVKRIMDSVEVIPSKSNSIFRMQKNLLLSL